MCIISLLLPAIINTDKPFVLVLCHVLLWAGERVCASKVCDESQEEFATRTCAGIIKKTEDVRREQASVPRRQCTRSEYVTKRAFLLQSRDQVRVEVDGAMKDVLDSRIKKRKMSDENKASVCPGSEVHATEVRGEKSQMTGDDRLGRSKCRADVGFYQDKND